MHLMGSIFDLYAVVAYLRLKITPFSDSETDAWQIERPMVTPRWSH
jgi:hypothetical protein